MLPTFWETLGIEPTRDERAIKRAYAARLKMTRPEDDPDAFQRLVTARDWALNFARSPEDMDDLPAPAATAAPQPEPIRIPIPMRVPEPVLPQPGPMPDPLAGDPQANRGPEPDPVFVKLEKDLDELVRSSLHAQGPGRTDGWSAERWTKLLEDSAQLSIDDRNRLFVLVARKIEHLLPPCHIVQRDEFAAFRRGRGKSAVVEVMEKECQFTWVGSGFERHLSPDAVARYHDWLSVAKSARQLVERLDNPSKGYFQPNSPIPLLPEEDQPVLLNSVPLRKYYETISKTGKWRYPFHLRSLFMPAGELLRMRVIREGAFFLITGLALVFACFKSMTTDLFGLLPCLLLLLLLHIAAAFTYQRSVIQNLGRAVQRADRSGQLVQKYRAAFFEEILGKTNWVLFFSFVDTGFRIILIVALFAVAPIVLVEKNADKTVDAIITPAVSSALDLTINSRNVSSEDLLEFFTSLSHTLDYVDLQPEDRSRRSGDLRYYRFLEDIDSALRPLEFALNQSADGMVPEARSTALFTERARKLTVVAEAYRVANAEQKTRMEHDLKQWLIQIKGASGNADLQAALWILMPPRTTDRPFLQPADVLRTYITRYYFDTIDSTAFRSNESRSSEINDGLLRVLSMSDADLEALIPTGDLLAGMPITPEMDGLSLVFSGNDSSVLFLKGSGNRERSLPAASAALSDWRDFLRTAELCLTDLPQYDRDQVRKIARQRLSAALQSRTELDASTWLSMTRALLDVPTCRLLTDVKRNGRSPFLALEDAVQLGYSLNDVQDPAILERTAFAIVAGASGANPLGSEEAMNAKIVWALALTKNGSPSEALNVIDTLNSNDRSCAEVYAARAYAMKALGYKDRAIKEFEETRLRLNCADLPHLKEFQRSTIQSATDQLQNGTGTDKSSAE